MNKQLPESMTLGEAIIIEPLGNGYLVRPLNVNGRTLTPGHVLVFNDLGVAEPSGLARDSALTCYIQKHFDRGEA